MNRIELFFIIFLIITAFIFFVRSKTFDKFLAWLLPAYFTSEEKVEKTEEKIDK